MVEIVFAQPIDPAPATRVEVVNLKKLRRQEGKSWKLPGHKLFMANFYTGLGYNANQDIVLYRLYPETDIAQAMITLDDSPRSSAEGKAIYLTPDGYTYTAGSFRDNKPHGEWISISPVNTNQANCLNIGFDTPKEYVLEILKDCYPDSQDQAQIHVQTATYSNGVLNGPASKETLNGTVQQSLRYAAGQPIGEKLNYTFGSGFKVVHTSIASDTIYFDQPSEQHNLPKFKFVEHMPYFKSPNCDSLVEPQSKEKIDSAQKCATDAMLQYIYDVIKYPKISRRLGVAGITVVTFVVETDGSLVDIRTVRFVSEALDAEARRTVASMPSWMPGVQYGETVRVQFNLPIAFRLE